MPCSTFWQPFIYVLCTIMYFPNKKNPLLALTTITVFIYFYFFYNAFMSQNLGPLSFNFIIMHAQFMRRYSFNTIEINHSRIAIYIKYINISNLFLIIFFAKSCLL